MYIPSFWHPVDSQHCCNILKVTFNVTLLQIWGFLSNTNIARSTEQSDEKCRIGPGHGREAGNEWPTLAHKKRKNTCDSWWSTKWRQPAGVSSGPNQNDCHETGRACWEHWCLFSSWPHSITRPPGPDALVSPSVFLLSLPLSLTVIFLLLLFFNILLDLVCVVGRKCPDLNTMGSEAKLTRFNSLILFNARPVFYVAFDNQLLTLKVNTDFDRWD